jgi:uncharacterized protein
MNIASRIAQELSVAPGQVEAAIRLLDEGATVPFIARYRKEATGGLDDEQLRQLEERLRYLRDLEERRETILRGIEEQGKLTDALRAAILGAETRARLEDLYLPYRPKRRTKAQIAREAGLEPLASALPADPGLDPETAAADYVDADKGVVDAKAALDGARQILMEDWAEDADLVSDLRERLTEQAVVRSRVVAGKETEGAKFADYFDYSEPLRKVPSHRALALLRGRKEGVLDVRLLEDQAAEERVGPSPGEQRVARHAGLADQGRPADAWLAESARWTFKVKVFPRLETELLGALRERAEEEAIRVFGHNLRDLLMAPPAGTRATMGLDPGLRTGVKVAVVDATGKLVATDTIFPHPPKKRWDESMARLAKLAGEHAVELVAVGNGTASRETDKLVAELCKKHPALHLTRVMVSEAGASVYSASRAAAREFPGLDVSLRGAVSIARRLQDPLAELVKIEPKAIGVGQYQHDVSQTHLARTLDAVVEDCVNAVGVDVNTASAALLSRVAGLSGGLAENIVALRDRQGPFRARAQLQDVPRLGPKTFEQAAGFLRIQGGDNPLDASAVHPEAYPVVERILAASHKGLGELIGNAGFLRRLRPGDYTDQHFGVPTVTDILKELEKPGRDPRPEFRTAAFKEGVENLADLRPGMVLEGVVSNVTNFGAFVDVGVHQDGLVHVSALSEKFVRDPREVVKAGDVVKVKVMDVDLARKRIGLSMRLDDEPGREARGGEAGRKGAPGKGRPKAPKDTRGPRQEGRQGPAQPALGGAMADAFARARKG